MFKQITSYVAVAVIALFVGYSLHGGLFAGTSNFDTVDANTAFTGDGSTIIDITGGSSTLAITGTSTFLGEIQARSLVQGDANGSLPAIGITTTTPNELTLTAAQICQNSVLDITAMAAATGTFRFASTTAMITAPNGCLDTVGDFKQFLVLSKASGSFALAVGGSSTLLTGTSASTTGTWVSQTSSIPAYAATQVTAYRSVSGSDPWTFYVQREVQ